MNQTISEKIKDHIYMEERQNNSSRGKLRIFFSYADGAGKTTAMLKAARKAKEAGTDVVVGYIEPGMAMKAEDLLEGLEVFPPFSMGVGGKKEGFDIQKTLERSPQLVVVDELACTNMRRKLHTKRYQDVKELLSRGMDVYTTVNVQDIESLNDIVSAITGIEIRERVPDRLFDRADMIDFIDPAPEEVLARFREGKIPGAAKRAGERIYEIDRLLSLRELAMKRWRDWEYGKKTKKAEKPEARKNEHILVCLSTAPGNARLIRVAGRMARAFKARFTALFVETPDFQSASDAECQLLADHMHIARQMGAGIETVYGEDIPLQISSYARLAGVTKIIVGSSHGGKRFFSREPAFVERLSERVPGVEIYTVHDKNAPLYKSPLRRKTYGRLTVTDVLKSLGILMGVTAVGFLFYQAGFSESNIIMLYLLGVLFTAVITEGRLYSIVFSLLSVLVFNFFFTVPRYSLQAYDPGYPATFLIMFMAAFLSSSLAVKMKRQALRSAETAYRTKVLLETNQLLQSEQDAEGIIHVTANQLMKLTNRTVIFYPGLEGEKKLDAPIIFPAGEEEGGKLISHTEQAAAAWCFEHNKHAGATTGTLGNAKCLYLSVRGSGVIYGVIGIALADRKLDTFTRDLMLSIIGECGLALDKELLSRKKEEASAQAKNEQLRADLLRSISHDLRTPLTSISGNAGVLLNNGGQLTEEKKQDLYTAIYDDSLWLINLVENLLAVTRIENGTIKLRMQMELMEEVVAEALRHINRRSEEYHIRVVQPEEFIIVRMDARLIVQVLINLVDNAVKYTPPGSDICIFVSRSGGEVKVQVADNGPGIPEEAREKVFEMFYTANNAVADSRRSMGLGL